MKKILILIILICFSCSYFEKKIFEEKNFCRLMLHSTGAWEQPETTIELNNQKKFKIHIKSCNDTLSGFYVGSISGIQYQKFSFLLSNIRYYPKDTAVHHIFVQDLSEHDLIIVKKNKRKYAFGQYDKEELDLINFLLDTYKNIELVRVDTILFDDLNN